MNYVLVALLSSLALTACKPESDTSAADSVPVATPATADPATTETVGALAKRVDPAEPPEPTEPPDELERAEPQGPELPALPAADYFKRSQAAWDTQTSSLDEARNLLELWLFGLNPVVEERLFDGCRTIELSGPSEGFAGWRCGDLWGTRDEAFDDAVSPFVAFLRDGTWRVMPVGGVSPSLGVGEGCIWEVIGVNENAQVSLPVWTVRLREYVTDRTMSCTGELADSTFWTSDAVAPHCDRTTNVFELILPPDDFRGASVTHVKGIYINSPPGVRTTRRGLLEGKGPHQIDCDPGDVDYPIGWTDR